MRITKRRIQKIIEKDPRLRTQKDLRKLAKYNYFKENPVNEETHGKMLSYIDRLYGRGKTPLIHPHPQVIKPYVPKPKPAAQEVIKPVGDKYKDKYKQLKNIALSSEPGKNILINMKAGDKYHGLTDKKKYKLLKYAIKLSKSSN